jgi:putative membrane protein
MAFVHALRISLRREDNFVSELEPFLDDSERELLRFEMNKPTAIAYAMGEKVSAARNKGWLHPMHQFQIEEQLTALTDIQGGCERILNTPIPLSHTALAHRIVAAYVVGLPFGLVDTVGLLTPVVVLLVAFAFYGLDAIGEEMEDPFGYDCNDLPLSSLSRMIENNLRQRLGEADLPPAVAPNASGVLS